MQPYLLKEKLLVEIIIAPSYATALARLAATFVFYISSIL